MGFVFFYMLKDILIFLSTVVIGIIIVFVWKNKSSPSIQKQKILFIIFPILLSFVNAKNVGVYIKKLYDIVKLQGFGHAQSSMIIRIYIPTNPEYIKNILIQDFKHFTDRGIYYNEKDDFLSANLVFLGGEKWRHLRMKLSPAFNSNKVKTMFDTLIQCGYQMQDAVGTMYKNKQVIDVEHVSTCYTINAIGACGFGLECNSLEYSEFEKHATEAFYLKSVFRRAKLAFANIFPKVARWLGIKVFDKTTAEFFTNFIRYIVNCRKNNNIIRKDLVQLLLELEQNSEISAINEITAQSFVFFVAGFETTSITLSYCLYELAENAIIQDKVRDEINRVLMDYEGKVTYDAVTDMKYMNQVVDETLRKYPPIPHITRKCVKDYRIPGTETVIKKETTILISNLGLHHDPDHYPEPEKFDPERFSEENKQKRLPMTYLPFGDGPRLCIAYRFGLMQVKVGLTILLKNYRFLVNERTLLPFQMDPYSFLLKPKTKIFLNIQKIS